MYTAVWKKKNKTKQNPEDKLSQVDILFFFRFGKKEDLEYVFVPASVLFQILQIIYTSFRFSWESDMAGTLNVLPQNIV